MVASGIIWLSVKLVVAQCMAILIAGGFYYVHGDALLDQIDRWRNQRQKVVFLAYLIRNRRPHA